MTSASHFFLLMLPVLVSYYARKFRVEDRENFEAENNAQIFFDFIVVGGGAAGCVVARRLADAKFRVLLLEAGGTPPPSMKIPLAYPGYLNQFNSDVTYRYHSTKQQFLGLDNNGIVNTEASKMLGGGTSHNAMIYQRGSPYDYDVWANMTGDDSWSYSEILPYFRKFENYNGNFSAVSNGQHGTGGPVTITSPYFPARDVWFEAGKELGYDFVDPNGPQRIGFSPNENYIDTKGWRVTSYHAYIEPVEQSLKDYLTVRRYSPVHKILFKGRKAIGVEYMRHGKILNARATKEIILCAGAYISPILLIKSGIGPLDEIRKAKVKPVQILPQVGQNLQDHVLAAVLPIKFISQPESTWTFKRNFTFHDFDDAVYRGGGPIGTPSDALAYIVSKRGNNENPKWPDLQIYYRYQPFSDGNTCLVTLGRPHSRGRLTMNESATSMTDDNLPILDYGYLTVRRDLDVIVEGIRFCLKVFEETTVFQNLGAKYTAQPTDSCKRFAFRSQNYWRCYVQHTGFSEWHASGTNRMGRKGDWQGSVVGPKLRVHGIKNLRVIDASIFPQITNANLAAPTYATAEKGVAGLLRKYL